MINITFWDGSGWLTTSPSSATGNATITVTASDVQANNWEATITISGGGLERYIDVVKYH